jgi:hypothetical protein
MKNFHLPLLESTYDQLRAAALNARAPATTLARQVIEAWLLEQSRRARHEAVASYATQMSGTKFDLDSDLESAGVEDLLKTRKRTK